MLLSFHLRKLVIIKWLSWALLCPVLKVFSNSQYLNCHWAEELAQWSHTISSPRPIPSQLLGEVVLSAWQFFIWHYLCLHFTFSQTVSACHSGSLRGKMEGFCFWVFSFSFCGIKFWNEHFLLYLSHGFGILALILLLCFQEKIFFHNQLLNLSANGIKNEI